MKVPFFGKDRYYQEYKEEILNTVNEVYSTGQVMQGPQVEEFERNIAKYCGRKFAIAVGSCTDALYFALLDAGIGPSDEVLVTGFSFVASASCIPKVGAVPVFVDINPDNYLMDYSDLEEKITDKTKAVIGVHLFGDMLDARRLENLAEKYGLAIIEDSAQSVGASLNGRKAGSIGNYSCISFDPTKLLSAQSNAGVLLTDDPGAYERLSQLRYHGKNLETGKFEVVGYNSRISSLQAALLDFNLSHLDNWIVRNRKLAEEYRNGLRDNRDIVLPRESTPNHVYHKYVIQTNRRDELREFLRSKGIQTNIHYDTALSEHPLFVNGRAERLDNIDFIKKRVLSLPIHPWLRKEEVDYVINSIK